MYAYRYREEVLVKWKEIRSLIGITEIERERGRGERTTSRRRENQSTRATPLCFYYFMKSNLIKLHVIIKRHTLSFSMRHERKKVRT